MTLAPIISFVYNRPEHTAKTIKALQDNELAQASELFIFSDGARNQADLQKVAEVRDFLKTIAGFKAVHIIERPENWGLAKSIINGVTEIVAKYDRAIIMEDDLITSPYFLRYMNEALDLYQNNDSVISIHGYVYPIKEPLPETFFIKGADCWGWATWKRAWDLFEPSGQKLLRQLESANLTKEFDFNNSFPYTEMLRGQISGKNDSWAIRWSASAFLKNKLTLYPGRSLVNNIGNDASGRHSGVTANFDAKLSKTPIEVGSIDTKESVFARKQFETYFRSLKPGKFRQIKKKLSRLLK